MDDLISRQSAIIAVKEHELVDLDENRRWYNHGLLDAEVAILDLPSAQPEIIRCKDCRWWDKYSDTHGYCLAAKHGCWTEHWDISIRRTYKEDFYCADAEPKGGQE